MIDPGTVTTYEPDTENSDPVLDAVQQTVDTQDPEEIQKTINGLVAEGS